MPSSAHQGPADSASSRRASTRPRPCAPGRRPGAGGAPRTRRGSPRACAPRCRTGRAAWRRASSRCRAASCPAAVCDGRPTNSSRARSIPVMLHELRPAAHRGGGGELVDRVSIDRRRLVRCGHASAAGGGACTAATRSFSPQAARPSAIAMRARSAATAPQARVEPRLEPAAPGGSKSNGLASSCQSRPCAAADVAPRVGPVDQRRVRGGERGDEHAGGRRLHPFDPRLAVARYRARMAASARGRSAASVVGVDLACRCARRAVVLSADGSRPSVDHPAPGVLKGAGTYSRWMTMR